ncbi:MAG: LysR substrate-binding domain-containing protein, partial [Cyanobium sp.]
KFFRPLVVSIDLLNSLDYLIWLRSGAAAAERLCVTQSTVSRNVTSVSKLFFISARKAGGEWTVLGETSLLNAERLVHQRYRWMHDLPLRIEAQYYSGPLFCDTLPKGWHRGNFDFLEVHTPLRHLRQGVIDAWIGCHPDVPDDDDKDLICFPLTRLPTRLVVAQDHPLLELGDAVDLDHVRQYPSLALPDNAFPRVQRVLEDLGLWNLPLNVNRYGDNWQQRSRDELAVGYATSFTLHLFQTPQIVLPIQIPLEVGDTLIVRRDFAQHPRLVELLSYLNGRALQLSAQFADVVIPSAVRTSARSCALSF